MNIKEYLGNAMKLEKTVYTLNITINYLQECQRNLGISKDYEYPYDAWGACGYTPKKGGLLFPVLSIPVGVIIGYIIGGLIYSFF